MAGSGERLAPVTYLPGVVAPPEPAAVSTGWHVETGADAATETDSGYDTALLGDDDAFVGGAGFVAEDEDDEPESAGERTARAENVSMRALTRHGMSVWEMERLLASRDLGEADVAHEVGRLAGVGLLDDRELAETLVRTLHERKGLGRSAITAELRRRHVDSEAIESALAEIDADDESARATELAVKRAPQLRSLDQETAKRRLSAFLMRKGYSGSVVSAAVAKALAPTGGVRFR